MEQITNAFHTHPIATIIALWLALELTAYVLISFGIIWRHVRHGFSWPVRAIRMARYYF